MSCTILNTQLSAWHGVDIWITEKTLGKLFAQKGYLQVLLHFKPIRFCLCFPQSNSSYIFISALGCEEKFYSTGDSLCNGEDHGSQNVVPNPAAASPRKSFGPMPGLVNQKLFRVRPNCISNKPWVILIHAKVWDECAGEGLLSILLTT